MTFFGMYVNKSNENDQSLVRIIGDLITDNSFFNRFNCRDPLAYKIGSIDERFGWTTDDVEKMLSDAEYIWEEQTGRDLFVNDPDNKKAVPVNFIFDKRQQELLTEVRVRTNLEANWQTYEEMLSAYSLMKKKYDEAKSALDKKVAQYESKLDEYNKKVSAWNKKRGGQSEYDALNREKKSLDSEKILLSKSFDSFNDLTDQLNSMSDLINDSYDKFASETDRYNDTFEGSNNVEVGHFNTKEINIFQFDSIDGLRFTLAHEMGHALGLDHVENKLSLMNAVQKEQDIITPRLTIEDIAELNDVCGFK